MTIINDLFKIIMNSAEGAFLQVGVFVGAVLLIFGYINYKKNGKLIESIEKSKKVQPIIGALLGLSPGCGGAILVMPLYIKGTISFGTVIAALISTMGDAAFVLITVMPVKYLWISALSFIVAIITGYIVDYFNLGNKLIKRKPMKSKEQLKQIHEKLKHIPTEFELSFKDKSMSQEFKNHIGHEEGDEIDIALHHNNKLSGSSFGYRFTHGIGYKIFWSTVTMGLLLGVLLLFQIDVNSQIGIPYLGSIIGISGTLFSIGYMILSKKFLQDDTHQEEESKLLSLKETLIHNAIETAFVTTWVFAAYVIYEFGVYFVGGELAIENWLTVTGVIAVLIGAIVGLIPGCGPQIIIVTLFLKGMIPFAALLANAISQDGDALFPLIAMDKKVSLWATIITTIPAIIVGLIFYFVFESFI
ncbi:putative manganese transporter [Oceanirhabdus sp. W0125-5]|uniref:putative manganese transporter n=1 Tax=Oceanirhabdus sp. W0125-5 TaxID=2999116 RepID=UPI0022F2D78B|nr:putative manganese transporter [Oceanirhabdus sp. W0125-5]WBW95181.1 putative manganese transporter [Oceanirhabdus sp. W0125-5]